MSIINKMLQELDKRNAGPVQAALPGQDTGRLTQQVRPVSASHAGSGPFLRVVAGGIFLALAWGLWAMWKGSPAPAPAASPAPAPAATRDEPKFAGLRFATEMAQPAAAPRGRDARAASPGVRETQARASSPAPEAEPKVAPPPRKPPVALDVGAARIDKRIDTTPRGRAESEYRRAMANVNQGRIAEGMDGLKASLAADPGYDTARQALVALLLEAKRTGDAAEVLQEGLAADPANSGYALLLARLSVERGDTPGALALLLRHLPAGQQSAEYRGFLGTLYQRAGRHAEAIPEYEFALRAKPGHGAWWAGLGISQEAVDRPGDARESYQRAKASGNLNAELAAYVDARLRQMH
jgi:MSHA biogenesis protein MshN